MESGIIDDIRIKSTSQGFSKKRLKPNTEYSYLFKSFTDSGRELFSVSGIITTGSLPVPEMKVSVSGTSISVDVTIPTGVKKVMLEEAVKDTIDLYGSFNDKNTIPHIINRTGNSLSIAETQTISLPNKNPATTYYLHVQSAFLGEPSDWSETESILTGTYLAPGPISSVRATSPDIGQVRLKWKWYGTYRGESVTIKRYQDGVEGSIELGIFPRSGVVGDLDDRENRVEIILYDQPSGERWTYVVTPGNQSGDGNSDHDSVIID